MANFADVAGLNPPCTETRWYQYSGNGEVGYLVRLRRADTIAMVFTRGSGDLREDTELLVQLVAARVPERP